MKPRRRLIDTTGVPMSAEVTPRGGGDIRGLQKAGGFGSYSAVGFRVAPPIDWNPAPVEPEPEAEADIERELAVAGTAADPK
ncbi:hypothetical protein [Nocardia sp. alder85J]|uniref:hypothetical protein n=1 Tax=Nocardia sp. alder85J TaxID=2862949 RepID=UPI001CD1C32E|nr:hypothetical protein [Nocardia sp. alder85J]MCX4091221.1 hypothetical protein [Nocardia sp. alder85J]